MTRLEAALNRAWAKFKMKGEYLAGLRYEQKLKGGTLFLAHSEGFMAGVAWYRSQIDEGVR